MLLFLQLILLFCHEILREFEGCYIKHCFLKLGAVLHRVILYKDNVNCEWSLASSRIIDDYSIFFTKEVK